MLNEGRFPGLKWLDPSTKTFQICWRRNQRCREGDEITEIIDYIGLKLWPGKLRTKWKENLRNCFGSMKKTFEDLTPETESERLKLYRIKERQTPPPKRKSPRALGRTCSDSTKTDRGMDAIATHSQQNPITCDIYNNDAGMLRSRSPVREENGNGSHNPDVRPRGSVRSRSTEPVVTTSRERPTYVPNAPGQLLNVPDLESLCFPESSTKSKDNFPLGLKSAQSSQGFDEIHLPAISGCQLTEITPTIPPTSFAITTHNLEFPPPKTPVSTFDHVKTRSHVLEASSEIYLSRSSDNPNIRSVPKANPVLTQSQFVDNRVNVPTNSENLTAMTELITGSFSEWQTMTSEVPARPEGIASNSGHMNKGANLNIHEHQSHECTASRAQTVDNEAEGIGHSFRLEIYYRYKQVMSCEKNNKLFTIYPGQSWYSSQGERLGEKIKFPELHSNIGEECTKEQKSYLVSIWNNMLRGVTICIQGPDVFAVRRCRARVISKVINDPNSSKQLNRDEKTHILDLRQYMQMTSSDATNRVLGAAAPQKSTSVKVRLTFGLKEPVDDLKHGAFDIDMTFFHKPDAIMDDEHSFSNSLDRIVRSLENTAIDNPSQKN